MYGEVLDSAVRKSHPQPLRPLHQHASPHRSRRRQSVFNAVEIVAHPYLREEDTLKMKQPLTPPSWAKREGFADGNGRAKGSGVDDYLRGQADLRLRQDDRGTDSHGAVAHSG